MATAAKLLAELAGKELQSARQLAAYAGLTPVDSPGITLAGKVFPDFVPGYFHSALRIAPRRNGPTGQSPLISNHESLIIDLHFPYSPTAGEV